MPSAVICMKNDSSELCQVLTAGHDVTVSQKRANKPLLIIFLFNNLITSLLYILLLVINSRSNRSAL